VSDTSPSIPTLHRLMQFAIPLVNALQFFILKKPDIIKRGRFQTSTTLGSEADLQSVTNSELSPSINTYSFVFCTCNIQVLRDWVTR
jgi:hypothetical protein